VVVTALAVTGCGSISVRVKTVTITAAPPVTAVASKKSAPKSVTASSVIRAFRAAGLVAAHATVMAPRDFGIAPYVGQQGEHFLVAGLAKGAGGRAMVFKSLHDLRLVKTVYDKLGRGSALLFSWTYANTRRLVLVQINGDLPAAKAAKYGTVVAGL